MDVPDSSFISNHDWDPAYLRDIFDVEFFDFTELFFSNITDMELLEHVEHTEKYCPITEDISLDDDTLCQAVKQIETE